jgi:calcium-dependent protein kinase
VIDFGTSDKLKKDQKFEEQIGTPLYIAPEVLSGSYNEKCDLWSCGVIMYIMLCGVPPFQGENDDEIYQKIKKNDVKFEEEIWDRISDKAKDLIKRFLTKNIKKRISAKEALEHPWIKDMKKINKISKEDLNEVVNNLRKYSATKKLQQSTLAYIVHNLTKKEDTDVLRSIFIEFDENGDGRLSKDELIQGLNLVLSPEESEKEVNRIMNIIDVDGNGFIEYEEFLRATLDKKKILTDENLRTAFRLYDIKNRNRINAKELGIVLGGGNTDVDENVWKELIDEADLNKDGEIDFEDFSKLMEEC